MPLISVIIPIYNVETYIRKCLDSILAQTHKNWEAILVDDGSLDNSGAICDEYATIDKRFKVIHQPNGGVSAARQTGLDNATGEYIIHCDPDDWVEHNMLEELLNCAKAENADMVICDFIIDNKNTTSYEKQNLQNPITAKEVQEKIITQQIHGSCCNKFVKRACIGDIGFYPAEISLCEDELFNIRLLNKEIKIFYLSKAFYHYNFDNSSSICHTLDGEKIRSKAIVISECEKFVDGHRYNNMYAMKKSLLSSLFVAKEFEFLKETFTEIHHRVIEDNHKYNFYLPLGYFLARALKGSPKIAHFMYKMNLSTIIFGQRIKSFIAKLGR